jgi:hypothetical protein
MNPIWLILGAAGLGGLLLATRKQSSSEPATVKEREIGSSLPTVIAKPKPDCSAPLATWKQAACAWQRSPEGSDASREALARMKAAFDAWPATCGRPPTLEKYGDYCPVQSRWSYSGKELDKAIQASTARTLTPEQIDENKFSEELRAAGKSASEVFDAVMARRAHAAYVASVKAAPWGSGIGLSADDLRREQEEYNRKIAASPWGSGIGAPSEPPKGTGVPFVDPNYQPPNQGGGMWGNFGGTTNANASYQPPNQGGGMWGNFGGTTNANASFRF